MRFQNELVSIIIPVYNTEKYLHNCIDSCLKQTYENIEIILINDGSTDSSSSIIKEYSDNHANIYDYHQKNEGASSARNLGLSKVNGEYIVFLDSDDSLIYQAVELLVAKISQENVDVVIPTKFIKKEIGGTEKIERLIPKHDSDIEMTHKDFIVENLIGRSRGWRVSSNIYRTEMIIQNNIRFPVGYVAEDLVFNLRYGIYSQSFGLIEVPTLIVNKRHDSVTATFNEKELDLILYLIDNVKWFLDKIDYFNKEIYYHSFINRNVIIYIINIYGKNSTIDNKKNKTINSLKLNKISNSFKVKEYIDPYWNNRIKVIVYKIIRRMIYRNKINTLNVLLKIFNLFNLI